MHVQHSCVSRKQMHTPNLTRLRVTAFYIILCRQETDEHVKITPYSLGHCIKKKYTKLNACTAFLCEQETDAYAKSHPTPGEPWASFSRRESNSHNDGSSNKV